MHAARDEASGGARRPAGGPLPQDAWWREAPLVFPSNVTAAGGPGAPDFRLLAGSRLAVEAVRFSFLPLILSLILLCWLANPPAIN